MQILINGSIPCQDAAAVRYALGQLKYPEPPELAKANAFLNVLGELPGRGWFLIARGDLNKLNLNAPISVTFDDEFPGGNGKVTLNNLIITKDPKNLTPGTPDDTVSFFLIEVADARHSLSDPFLGHATSRQYNLRAPAWGGQYYESSLNSGSTFSWQDMVSDLWDLMSVQLGENSTLPVTPGGTPEGWNFQGDNAWDALCRVLGRLSCAVRFDPVATSNQFSIVRVGDDDAATDAIINAAIGAGRLMFDSEYQPITLGKIAGNVRVYFHTTFLQYGTEQTTPRTMLDQWLSTSTYVDVDGQLAGSDTTLSHVIWDDLPALFDYTFTLTNSAALQARALERAVDYYDSLLSPGGDRVYQVFSGIIPTLKPGPTLKGVSYRQDQQGIGDDASMGEMRGGALITEIMNYPFYSVDASKGSFQVVADYTENDIRGNTSDQRSYLGPQFPIYPPLLQILRVTGAPTGSLYPAVVETLNPDTLLYIDRESVWAFDINAGTLTTGERYFARVTGYTSGKPLYQVTGCCGGGCGYCYVPAWFSYTATGGSELIDGQDDPPVAVTITKQLDSGVNGAGAVDLSYGYKGCEGKFRCLILSTFVFNLNLELDAVASVYELPEHGYINVTVKDVNATDPTYKIIDGMQFGDFYVQTPKVSDPAFGGAGGFARGCQYGITHSPSVAINAVDDIVFHNGSCKISFSFIMNSPYVNTVAEVLIYPKSFIVIPLSTFPKRS